MTIAVRGYVLGRVQGVGYRMFTKDQADKQHVLGFVENCADGSVAFLLQGEEQAVQSVLTALKQGPRFGRVDQCDWEEVPTELDLKQFAISQS